VYFAGAFERGKLVFVKIGYTGAANPNTRLTTIRQGVPHEVRLLAAVPGCLALEAKYHQEFRRTNARGEWFEPSPDIMMRVETILAMRGSWKPWYGKKVPRRRHKFVKAEGLVE